MPTIPTRGPVKFLLEVDVLLIFGARLFMQLDGKSDFAQMFNEASGLSIIATEFIALWYSLDRLSLKWPSARRIRHLATTALSSISAGFLAVSIVLPFTGFPPASSILATLLLQLGLFLVLPVPVLLILHRVLYRSANASTMNDAVLHGRSILLVNDKRRTALCILRLASQQVTYQTSLSKNRFFTSCLSEDPEVTNGPPPEYPHLTPSHNNVPEFSIEFTAKNGLVSANLLVSSTNSDPERAARSAEQKTEELRSVLQTRFHKNIEFLEDQELWTTYKSLLGEHPAYDPTLWSVNETSERHAPSNASKNLAEQTTRTQEPD